MELNEFKETFQKVLKSQRTKARKKEWVNKSDKKADPIFKWRWKYDAWLLEPRHIALKFDITISQLERIILDFEDNELKDIWEDYKLFQKEVMLYDERFRTISAQLAEFALKKFDKNETTRTDAIIKLPTKEIIELREEVKKLKEKLNEYATKSE